MDISNFITWFIDQVVKIFTFCFNTLDSITFLGTSLLRVIITITILVPLLGVLLTLSFNNNVVSSSYERVRSRKEKPKKNEKE